VADPTNIRPNPTSTAAGRQLRHHAAATSTTDLCRHLEWCLDQWSAAPDLARLGYWTACWLEGSMPVHPVFERPPADETADLIPVLASANRAGLVTIGAQRGVDELDELDEHHEPYRQRAAVQVLAAPTAAHRLATEARQAGLQVTHPGPARRWRCDHALAVPVTEQGGQATTDFGTHLSRWTLRRHIFPGCSPAALDDLYDAHQVILIDPAWGRNDRLWPLLAGVVDGAVTRANR
jgi:hypothetical protein